MDRIKLSEYVKDCRKKGFSDSQIKSKLIENKYDEDLVDKTIKSLKKPVSIKKIIVSSISLIIIAAVIAGFFIDSPINDFVNEQIINKLKNPEPENLEQYYSQKDNETFKMDLERCGECAYLSTMGCTPFACCYDSDCEDGDERSVNICSGVPKMCYTITYRDCEGDECGNASGFGGSGGGGNNNNAGGAKNPPGETGEPCSPSKGCGSDEECVNGFCNKLTCGEMGGRNCDWDRACDGVTVVAYDNYRCCLGNCIPSQLDCISDLSEVASQGCDPGCTECKCTETGANIYRDANWENEICLILPSEPLYEQNRWMDYWIPYCLEGENTDICQCGEYFCGYDEWSYCYNDGDEELPPQWVCEDAQRQGFFG
jgi:hypothetical protein